MSKAVVIIFALEALAFVSGLKVLNIDELLNTKGVFGDQSVVVPTIGVNAVSQAVNKFSSILSIPGTLDSAYENYASKFNKESEDGRKETFKDNILSVFEHNLNAKAGRETFTMGVNLFSDMTLEEVRAKYTGAILPNATRRSIVEDASPVSPFGRRSQRAAPDSMDWRQYGIITPPKMQGQCGSCTDFALTGGLEAAMGLYKGTKNLDLSEQELVDCPTGSGVGRCSGNWPEDIYEYQKKEGQTTEASYKYEEKEGSCRAAGKKKVAKVSNYYRTKEGDENMLKEWVGTYGPHSIVIEVNKAFSGYKGGIMNSPCGNTRYDHSVLVVGYGSEKGQDYWIVKNSWDVNWGEKGYIRMARNAKNLCRVADYAILPQA